MPETKIDISNYLTEILVKNYLDWLKKPLPKCPFWRKDIVENNSDLKKLRDKYVAELTEVKELLHVFSPSVLAEDFTKNKRVGIKIVKGEYRQTILMNLIKLQIAYTKVLLKEPVNTTQPKKDGVAVKSGIKQSLISL